MKRWIANIAVLATMALSMASCELRPLYEEGVTPVKVLVCMDWTQLGLDPDGATILFYPENGGSTYAFKTNGVKRSIVKVPSGYYTVMVFNRTADEFGTMSFAGLNKMGTARCILESKLFSWLGRNDTLGRTVYEPEEIVVGRTDHFQVRLIEDYYMIPGADTLAYVDSVMVRSLRMVKTGTVKVRVNGIQNVRSVRAYLTGMAGGAYLSTRSSTDTLATHVLENWTLDRESGDYTKGYVSSEFQCLGLPPSFKNNQLPQNNKLHIDFLLVDNKTLLSYQFNVGDLIVEKDSDLTVKLIINGSAITLPDVKPEGSSSSGFNVTLDDWGESQDVFIPAF